jgi:hypothetical protein
MFLTQRQYAGSVLVDRQWNLMDYSEDTGEVLLTGFEPERHFIVIDGTVLWDAQNARGR